MDNSKVCQKHKSHQKTNTNSQKSKQSSLKSKDSGLSPEPNYDKYQGSDFLIQALNNDMIELRARLQKSDLEKEELKMQIRELFDEKDNTQRHLEAISQAHESRITEMHCVIVELNKKLKVQQETAIIEETEPEGSVSELSFQEGSIYNSEMGTANYEHNEDSDIDQKVKSHILEQDMHQQKIYEQNLIQQKSSPSLPTPNYSSQIQCMQEEILHLRAQIALLQSELACRDYSHEKLAEDDCTDCKNEENENDRSNYTSDDLCETADIFDVVQQKQLPVSSTMSAPEPLNEFSRLSISQCQNTSTNSPKQEKSKPILNSEIPIPKIAERVKLKRTLEEDNFIMGNELTSKDIFTTEIAEHLVSEFMQTEEEASSSASLQNELSRLQRRIEHLKLQNSVLSLTLAESKKHCNHLYLLCGKYESNAVALQSALNCNDRAIEAYDVMLALLESKLGMLENVESAQENRNAAESVAHLLLERFKNESSFHGKSSAPWENAVVILPGCENEPWTVDHDRILRNQVSKLKGQRSFIQNTVVNLESPFNFEDASCRTEGSRSRSRQKCMDIETAILMQELMSLREDMCDLKHQAEQSEKQKLLAHEQLKSLQNALVQLQCQLNESESKPKEDRFSYSEAEYSASIERELMEAMALKARLKARLQSLAGSLGAAARITNSISTKQSVSELKQTNLS